MKNPFVTKGYAGAEYFCDRVKETSDLVRLLTNDNNMALISPRRIGKTDLIHHCFAQPEIEDSYYTFVIDIYATNSLADFVEVFGKAILEALKSRGRKVWEQFLNAMKSLQQQFSFDINGNPVWGVGLGAVYNPATTLDEIFHYLESADKPCLIAIDEFQKVLDYPHGNNIEALLRTYVQRCPNATFLFCGSKRHLMTEIFMSPSRPFYQSVITMGLAPISVERYVEFACEMFRRYEKSIDEDVVRSVYDRFDGITAYLQRVMNVLFLNTERGGSCDETMIDDAIDYLITLNSEHYEMLFAQLSEKQRQVFIAIAAEGRAKGLSGGRFLRKYRMASASSVVSAVRGLLEKDFITQNGDEYMVYDYFFRMWLKKYDYID